MDIEKQVCSLELAKKLKDLGVKQESVWHWRGKTPEAEAKWKEYCEAEDSTYVYEKIPPQLWQGKSPNFSSQEFSISAFTVAELGEMLPMGDFALNGVVAEVVTSGSRRAGWFVFFQESESFEELRHFLEPTEADARAKALIWLIENGHMEV